MASCFSCKREVGKGGVVTEDGRLLCAECDAKETAKEKAREKAVAPVGEACQGYGCGRRPVIGVFGGLGLCRECYEKQMRELDKDRPRFDLDCWCSRCHGPMEVGKGSVVGGKVLCPRCAAYRPGWTERLIEGVLWAGGLCVFIVLVRGIWKWLAG